MQRPPCWHPGYVALKQRTHQGFDVVSCTVDCWQVPWSKVFLKKNAEGSLDSLAFEVKCVERRPCACATTLKRDCYFQPCQLEHTSSICPFPSLGSIFQGVHHTDNASWFVADCEPRAAVASDDPPIRGHFKTLGQPRRSIHLSGVAPAFS